MKILAIADRPPKTSLEDILKNNDNLDLIVTLGDLSYYDIHYLSQVTTIPKIGIYGNHDFGDYMDSLGIKNMHLQTFEYKGVIFGGLQGSVRYKSNPDAIMYNQDEVLKMLENFPRTDIFISHCPPYGINDEPGDLTHEGFHGLRKYIEKHNPKYVFHGHTYPTEETIIKKFKNTEIIYVYQDKIVELDF